MNKKIIIAIIGVLLVAVLLAGCTESYKVDAIETDFSDLTVSSNGGLAVKVGRYLYYINGYAGNTVDNTFGNVQKGAIARVELDEGGSPIDRTNTIIVSKNVYNTTKTSGLYVVEDYIYYSSPSTEKGKSGEPKISQMHLMRTKLDGTGTQIVAKFNDYTPVYKVVKGAIIYVNSNNELRRIDLSSKKFNDSLITDKVTSYHMPTYNDNANSFVDSVFYIKASENKNQTHSVLWSYRAGGEPRIVIEANEKSYNKDLLEHPLGYTLTIVESAYVGENLRLIYNKSDSGSNATSSGTYSYDFDSSLEFDSTKEERYSWKTNYSSFRFLDDGSVIALAGNNLVWLQRENNKWEKKEDLIVQSSAPVIFDVEFVNDSVVVYYLASSKLLKIQVLQKTEEGEYRESIKSASEVFTGAYSDTWLGLDKVGSHIYFFNSDMKDNTYFLNLATVINRDTESQRPTLLGLMTNADELDLVS